MRMPPSRVDCGEANWEVLAQSPVNLHGSRNEYCPTPKNMGVS